MQPASAHSEPLCGATYSAAVCCQCWREHVAAMERSSLSEVIIHEDENFERALKRFKKKCEKAGILSDLRKHRHYEKPSERRKRKMNAAVRKNRRTRQG